MLHILMALASGFHMLFMCAAARRIAILVALAASFYMLFVSAALSLAFGISFIHNNN